LWRDTRLFTAIADVFAVLTAAALPWSTSLVVIFGLCWLGAAALTIDYGVYFRSLKQPIFLFPFVLFALAVAGIVWSSAPWAERFLVVGPAARFLMLPGLFYHFQRSSRGMWVLVAFVASCSVLMVMSWLAAIYPNFTLKSADTAVCGVFVRNYIDQGQEFVLCAVGLAYPIFYFLRERKWLWASLLTLLALSFVVNMTFVVSSRTALLTIPVLCMVMLFRHANWRTAIPLSAVAFVVGIAMAQSPRLCPTFDTARDYQRYQDDNAETSTGVRLELWKKSIGFFMESPIIGHGTGSIRGLFEKAAVGKTGAEAVVLRNPHNQTLNVAVQWGVVGILVLFALWFSHLMFFQRAGWAASIGLLIVVQNIFSSLFNSHLFDFTESWLYILGVGIAGGMQLRHESERRERLDNSAGSAGRGADGLPPGRTDAARTVHNAAEGSRG